MTVKEMQSNPEFSRSKVGNYFTIILNGKEVTACRFELQMHPGMFDDVEVGRPSITEDQVKEIAQLNQSDPEVAKAIAEFGKRFKP